MKKKKQKKYVIFLRSTQITAALLLLLLIGNLVHMFMVGKQDGRQQERTIVKESEPLEKEAAVFSKGSSTAAKKSAGAGVKQPTAEKSAGVKQPAADSSLGGSSRRGGENASKKSEPAGDTTLVFAGDIYLSDYVLAGYNQSGIEGILSKQMLKELQQADFTIVNNEFPYSTRGTQAPDKQFTFRIDPSYVSVLQESGVDIVTLANNHVLDYGKEALSDTFQTLDDAGIAYMGAGDSLERAGRLITKKANGRTFGFLAASRVFPVVSWNVENEQPGVFSAYDPAKLTEAVKDAAKQCDFLCVYVHWGIERSETPEDYQVTMAHALIDAGADAVIGAHPHVLQSVEYYKGKPVFYSLGNFIFYQSIERTAIAKLTLASDGTAKWQLVPARAADARTFVVDDKAACKEFYEYMTAISTGVEYAEDGVLGTAAK